MSEHKVEEKKELSPELHEELLKIVNDPYSFGAFTGMIYNSYIGSLKEFIDNDEKPIKDFSVKTLVTQALMIRVETRKMVGEKVIVQEPKKEEPTPELVM